MTPNEYQQLALRTDSDAEQHHDLIRLIDQDRQLQKACADKAIQMPARIDPLPSPDKLGDRRLLHGAIGVGTEAGELLDQVKRHMFYGTPIDIVNVLEECGDVLWYLAVALDSQGLTMEQAMERNIAKLRRRFPERFEAALAVERDLDAERAALEAGPIDFSAPANWPAMHPGFQAATVLAYTITPGTVLDLLCRGEKWSAKIVSCEAVEDGEPGMNRITFELIERLGVDKDSAPE